MRKSTAGDGPWQAALRRATDTAASRLGSVDEDCWDDVAIRDIIAVTLYALHVRDGRDVDDVPWASVLWWLWDDERVIALVEETVPGADAAMGSAGGPGASADPVAARWCWLNRTWDPDAPLHRRSRASRPDDMLQQSRGLGQELLPAVEARWEGMSRGIANALPDPAIEICTHWAAGAVAAALSAANGGYEVHQRVRATAGAFEGQAGYVSDVGWEFDDTAQQVIGPAGYVVDFDDVQGTVGVDSEHLAPATDHRWPRRSPGSLKDGPPAGLDDRLAQIPHPTCAEDLDVLLGRASNPQRVPEELRQLIRAAHQHHHLDVRRQASPRPHRVTVQRVLHWYQLAEHYPGGPEDRAEVWEVRVTRHLHDEEPECSLALDRKEAEELAERLLRAS
ncbi:hypothetical protein [Streptomyces caatingaensis]|uniref:Uncharacterized protein n=1 Tax=Streptomyces caatingaensis TaxID=1678637 RepID=A0A0K9XK79_9ACTN|nr:hypothetical protein [Streptomyces caatingaensis]KNB53496.1 hypothetical protein AC230_02175 [Streptomyces caatingaensis]